MALQVIRAADELDAILGDEPVVIGFFGNFSDTARAAQPAFEQFADGHDDHPVLLIDVGAVKGVHKRFGVSAVPTVVLVQDGQVLRQVVGPQAPGYYARALFPSGKPRRRGEDEPRQPRVTLYVSSTCPWCTKARNYLKRRQVRFSETNVSLDINAARDLQRRSGQTGVPQVDIGGQFVVGFNKPRIDELLGLRPDNS